MDDTEASYYQLPLDATIPELSSGRYQRKLGTAAIVASCLILLPTTPRMSSGATPTLVEPNEVELPSLLELPVKLSAKTGRQIFEERRSGDGLELDLETEGLSEEDDLQSTEARVRAVGISEAAGSRANSSHVRTSRLNRLRFVTAAMHTTTRQPVETEDERKQREQQEAALKACERHSKELRKTQAAEKKERTIERFAKTEEARRAFEMAEEKREQEKNAKEEHRLLAEKLLLQKQAAQKKEDAKEKQKKALQEKRKLDEDKQLKAKEAKTKRLTAAYEQSREILLERVESYSWADIVKIAKMAFANPDVASALAAAKDNCDVNALSSQSKSEAEIEGKAKFEEHLDAQLACLGSFFVLGMRSDPAAPNVNPQLRNALERHNQRIRNALAAGQLLPQIRDGTKPDQDRLTRFLKAARHWKVVPAELPNESALKINNQNTARGETHITLKGQKQPAPTTKKKPKPRRFANVDDEEATYAAFLLHGSTTNGRSKN